MPRSAPKKTYSTDWQRKKATKGAIEKFEATFAKDMGMTLDTDSSYDAITTGSLEIDYALGIGGLPTGRICEIWGPEHAGKTSLCMGMVAEYQKAFPDQMAAWVDMEQTFDEKWAESLGVDLSRLWRPPVKTAEDTADATKRLVESGLCSIVILDSVGGMIAKMEMQKEADEATVGLVAKIVTRMVKHVSPMCKSNGTTVMVVNQVRAVIGNSYGPDETTSGGWALKHVTSVRLRVRRGETHKVKRAGQEIPCGHEMVVQVQKNKMAPYGTSARVWFHNIETDTYGPIGVDLTKETFDFAKRFNLFGDRVSKGGYYVFPDETEVRSEAKALDFLRTRDDLRDILRSRVMATLTGTVHDETDEGSEDVEEDFSQAMKISADVA